MSAPTSQAYNKQLSPHISKGFRVEITRTTGIWPRSVFVQWTLRKPTVADGHSFSIYRSGSAEGPWEEITTLTDTYFFVDDTWPAPRDKSEPGLFSLRRTVYYRITVDGPEGFSEDVKVLEASPDRRRKGMITKLRRDAAKMLQRGNGTEVAIFKRKWWGTPCSCITATGQSVRSHCHACLGTGIINGYWDPVYGYASRSATPVTEHTTTSGTTEVHTLNVITLDIPVIAPRDVLVFLRDNKRYIVDQLTPTEIQTVLVHQELSISELPKSSIEYALEADRWHTPKWF